MAANIFGRYVWLVDVLLTHKKVRFEEISRLWQRCGLSYGEELPIRTFHNHRNAIFDIFGIDICCERKGKNSYYFISNPDQLNTRKFASCMAMAFQKEVNSTDSEFPKEIQQLRIDILLEEMAMKDKKDKVDENSVTVVGTCDDSMFQSIANAYLLSKVSTYSGEALRVELPAYYNLGQMDFLNGLSVPHGKGRMKLLGGYEIEGEWEFGKPLLDNIRCTFNEQPVPIYSHGTRQWVCREGLDEKKFFNNDYFGCSLEIFDDMVYRLGSYDHYIQIVFGNELYEIIGETISKRFTTGIFENVAWNKEVWKEISEDIANELYDEEDVGCNVSTLKLHIATKGNAWNKLIADCKVKQEGLVKDEFAEWLNHELINYTELFKEDLICRTQ